MKAVRPILIVLFLAAFSRPVTAQWTPLYNFTGEVKCIYFVDGSLGFVGANNSIYRTQDGGTTWTLVMQSLAGDATSFDFKDGLNGWCSIAGTATSPACYRTNNGGRTWAPLGPLGDASDVHYNQSTKLLFLSIRLYGAGSLVSANDGSTWSNLSGNIDENGFAFTDAQFGILSAYQTQYYRTSNGGATWTSLNYIRHSWSPCAMPGTQTIMAAGDGTSAIYRSDDAGLTWYASPGVPGGVLTGCVQASACGVYVQTDVKIYVSSDLVHWTSLGGPGNGVDTRFYVGGAGIFAADFFTGMLYRLPVGTGNWSALLFAPTSLSISEPAGCKPTIASAQFQNISCGTLTILSASITDTTNWRLNPTKFPMVLQPGDTVQLSFATRSKSIGVFNQSVHLQLRSNAGVVDTTFPLSLSVLGILPPTLHTLSITLPDRCTPLDTFFRIHNNHCDTISLTSLGMRDSMLFRLGTFKLPLLIPPDSECRIPLRVRAKAHGTFWDTAAITLSYPGYNLDTLLSLNGTVRTSAISASLDPISLTFDTISICDTGRRILFVHNFSCDSVEITELLLGTNSRFTILSPKPLVWIRSGDSAAIEIQILGAGGVGTASGKLDIMLNTGASERLYSTALSGTVVPSIPRTFLSSDAIVIDSIEPCATIDTTISVRIHGLCEAAVIDSAYVIGNDSIIGSGPVLPAHLARDSAFRYRILYNTESSHTVDALLHLHGTGLDTSVPIHLSVRRDTTAHLALSAPRTSLVARLCEMDSVTADLAGGGCMPNTITGISLVTTNPAQTQFEMDSTVLPRRLSQGSSLPIHIRFRGDGVGDGHATIVARESNGSTHRLTLSGTPIPAGNARLAIALAPGSTLHPIAGDAIAIKIFFADSIEASSALQSVRCKLTVNGNILTNESAMGMNGWQAQQEASSRGELQWICTRPTSAPISAGDVFMSLRFHAAVSDSLSAPITLASTTFSPDDSNYERCILASAISQPRLGASITPGCGDSLLSGFIREGQIIYLVNLHPNPVESTGGDLTIALTSNSNTAITLALLDVLGRVRSQSAHIITRGENALTQSVAGLEPGMYSVVISADGTREVRRVMVMR